MEERFQTLSENILNFLWAIDPVKTTSLGLHQYDHCYGSYTPQKRKEYLNTKKAYLMELQTINPHTLSPVNRVDLQILMLQLRKQIYE